MRSVAVLLAILFLLAPALAQDPKGAAGGSPTTYESTRYQVKVTAPAGWSKAWEGPESAASWVKLVRFEESRTQAQATLSASATHHRSADSMIKSLKKQFDKDARIAILRREDMGATSKRPKGVLFEYTMRGADCPIHAVAAYFLHLSKRYRVYATVKETGWRSAAEDIESLAKSLVITSRAFSEDKQNYRDDGQNYALYFPETWAVRVPARGPRVVFESSRLGVAVRVYVTATKKDISTCVSDRRDQLTSEKAEIMGRVRPETHHALGIKTATIDYTRKSSGKVFRYRETMLVQKERLYRLVLVAAVSVFDSGVESHERMISSLTFEK